MSRTTSSTLNFVEILLAGGKIAVKISKTYRDNLSVLFARLLFSG
jgi:hypothetical protein